MQFIILFSVLTWAACATAQIKTIPYSLGGANVVFDQISVGNETLECHVIFPDGRDSLVIEPTIPQTKDRVTCRLPPKVTSGRIDVELVEKFHPSKQAILRGLFFLTPTPLNNELQVTEFWDSSEVELVWSKDYFDGQYGTGASYMLSMTMYVSELGTSTFVATGVSQLVGANDGRKRVTLTATTIQNIEALDYPYFYVIRRIGTDTDVYLSSNLITPTLGKTPASAKDICGAWLLNATGPPEEITPCPNCHCKAKLDPEFVQVDYVPQIVQLANGELAGHELFYQRVPTANGHAQTCSYKVATNELATRSPAVAGWIHYVSKDNSYIDNYLSDIWPYIVCCLQTKSAEFCTAFHEKRPIDTGHDYPGPDDPCYGTGDPHMNTFDGVRYDFMGFGEFWLITGPNGDTSGNFGVQGRMAPLNPAAKVTYYRAVAMREGNTTIQIHHRNGKLEILYNGTPIQISTAQTIPLGDVNLKVAGVDVEVRLRSGFTIKATSYTTSDHFNLYGNAAQVNKGQGYMGIFGNYDGDRENDLTTRNGTIIPPVALNLQNLPLLHQEFGLPWQTTADTSFFTYFDGADWESHQDVSFGPIDAYPNPADMPEEVRRICGESLACYYEYIGTGELGDAEQAAGEEAQHDELKEELEEKIIMCGHIGAIPNGRIDVEGYLNGSVATYVCNEEYDIEGSNKRTCSQVEGEDRAEWTGVMPTCIWTCTKCLEDTEYVLTHDPADCTKFFLCSFGERFRLDCPDGEGFNREFQVCDKNYECGEDQPGC